MGDLFGGGTTKRMNSVISMNIDNDNTGSTIIFRMKMNNNIINNMYNGIVTIPSFMYILNGNNINNAGGDGNSCDDGGYDAGFD
jgi:hypothetical protein